MLKLNNLERTVGTTLEAVCLDNAVQVARRVYGPDSTNQEVVDLLTDPEKGLPILEQLEEGESLTRNAYGVNLVAWFKKDYYQGALNPLIRTTTWSRVEDFRGRLFDSLSET